MRRLALYLSALLCCVATSSGAAALKLTPVHPRLYESYAGNYRLANDRFLSIGAFFENGNRLMFFDSKTRRFGVLYDVSDTEFVSGVPRDSNVVEPTDVRATFRDNALVWREGDAPPVIARRVSPHRNEEVTFQNGSVTLHGTLTLPATPGPHPAIVFLPGAGPAQRPFGMWPYFLARLGIATLVFDKRGSGASTGDWQTASFEDLAGDALAGVDLLRRHPGIDSRQIGLWGNSNSGWVVPVAASRSKDVAFVISRVGSALPPHENILYEMGNDARQRGLTDQEVEHALALRGKYHQAILTNRGWEELKSEVERSKGERWLAAARMARFQATSIPPNAATLAGLRKPLDFDPLPFWERVTCPVLALYGEKDEYVQAERSAPLLEAALKRAGNKDVTIVILPNANHGLTEVSPDGSGTPGVRRFASGYLDGIATWLSKRVKG